MKNEVRFRVNAAGIQYFNPSERKWIDVKDSVDYQDLLQLINNVTRDYPSVKEG